MNTWISPDSVLAGLAVISAILTAFMYFRRPQEKSEKNEALFSQALKNLSDSTDRRFKEMQDSFQALLQQNNNHIHTIDTKVEAVVKSVADTNVQLAKLSTIIDERIPRNHD